MLIPSCVTWVQVGRPPLIVVVVRVGMPTTPACSLMRSIGLRPGSGRSMICRWLTVLLTSGVEVLTRSSPAETCTTSFACPTSSVAVSEYSCPGSTFAWV